MSAYSDLTTAAGFESTGAIHFIKSNGEYYLIGGYGSWSSGGGVVTRLVKFDGITFTDLTDQLIGFSGKEVLEAEWDSVHEYWLIGCGGIFLYHDGALNKYDGTTFTDLTAAYQAVSGFTSAGVFKSNGSYWLIATAKGPADCLVKYDGTTFTMTSLVVGDYIQSITNKGDDWLIGGCTGQLVKFDGTTFTDLEDYMIPFNPSNLADAHPFGGGNYVQANDDYWLISSYRTVGSPTTLYPVLVKWDGVSTWTDYSASIPYYSTVGLGMYKVLWDGTQWIFNLGAYICTFNITSFASYDILPYSPRRLCVTGSFQFLSSYNPELREDTLLDTFKRTLEDSFSLYPSSNERADPYRRILLESLLITAEVNNNYHDSHPKESISESVGLSENISRFHTHVESTSTRYEYYITGDDTAYHGYGSTWSMQTFTVAVSHTIKSIKLKLYRVGTGGGTFTASIRATSAGLPTGDNLCSGTIDGGSLTTDTAGDWYEITLGDGVSLTAAKYAICVRSDGDSSNYVKWKVDTAGSYSGGSEGYSLNAGSTWTARTANDYMFEDWGVVPYNVYYKYISETLDLASSINKVRSISKILDDALNIISEMAAKSFKSLSSSLSLTETIAKLTSHIVSDAVTLAESIVKSIKKSIASAIEIIEALSRDTPGQFRKLISDGIDLIDTLITLTEYHRTKDDSLTLVDTKSRLIRRAVTDSQTLTDTFSRLIRKVTTETLSITETLSKVINKSISSTVTVLDTWFNKTILTLTDSISLAETLGRAIKKTATSTISLVETLSKKAVKVLSNAISVITSSVRSITAEESASGISGLFIDDFILQSNTLTTGTAGGHSDDYTQVTKTFRGQLSRISGLNRYSSSGREGSANNKKTAYATHTLYCAHMDVTEKDRVIFGDRTFLVTGVKEPSNAGEHLEIDLMEL